MNEFWWNAPAYVVEHRLGCFFYEKQKFFVTKRELLRLTNRSELRGGYFVAADFEQLYKTHYMKVYSFVMTFAKNQEDAEEITQKTFFKALTTDKKNRGNSSEFTWLCAIAKNLFVDGCRAQKRAGVLDADIESDTDIENTLIDEDAAFRIHQVLHRLDEPYKEVFQLRVFGELSFQKIGLIFGKTESWARVTYHRARQKIKERMSEK